MDENTSDAEPMPAVPLEYYQQTDASWRGIVRWAAWVAMAYSLLSIAATLPAFVFYLFPRIVGPSRVMVTNFQNIVLLLPALASAGLLFSSGITLLRRARVGQVMLVGSCLAMVACSVTQSVYSIYNFSTARGSGLGQGFVVYQCLSQFFSLLRACFVPTVLIVLFCKREIKEAIGI